VLVLMVVLINFIGEALRRNGNLAPVHLNLGTTLRGQGRH
jgi:hypothetical protein